MATISSPAFMPRFEPSARLLTAADVAAMPDRLPSGPVSFELHHGRLVAMSPPGARHGNLQARLGSALVTQGEVLGHGAAYTEVGIVLGREPDLVFGADAAFVAKQSLPAKISSEGFLETIPDLVIEVRSKNDSLKEMNDRVVEYLKAGVRLVWVVEPPSENVVEHRGGQPAKPFGKGDTLRCEDVIPGFRLELAELFR